MSRVDSSPPKSVMDAPTVPLSRRTTLILKRPATHTLSVREPRNAEEEEYMQEAADDCPVDAIRVEETIAVKVD